jgi:hypothetical protein
MPEATLVAAEIFFAERKRSLVVRVCCLYLLFACSNFEAR